MASTQDNSVISFQFQCGLTREPATATYSNLSLRAVKELACLFIERRFPGHGIAHLPERLLLYRHDPTSENVLQMLQVRVELETIHFQRRQKWLWNSTAFFILVDHEKPWNGPKIWLYLGSTVLSRGVWSLQPRPRKNRSCGNESNKPTESKSTFRQSINQSIDRLQWKVHAWLIDLIHRRENCPTGMISGWVQKVTEHRGTIKNFCDYIRSIFSPVFIRDENMKNHFVLSQEVSAGTE